MLLSSAVGAGKEVTARLSHVRKNKMAASAKASAHVLALVSGAALAFTPAYRKL